MLRVFLLNQVKDGFCIPYERSQDQQFTVGESSTSFLFKWFFNVSYWVFDDNFSEILYLFFLTIFNKNVVKVVFNDCLWYLQTFVIKFKRRFRQYVIIFHEIFTCVKDQISYFDITFFFAF